MRCSDLWNWFYNPFPQQARSPSFGLKLRVTMRRNSVGGRSMPKIVRESLCQYEEEQGMGYMRQVGPGGDAGSRPVSANLTSTADDDYDPGAGRGSTLAEHVGENAKHNRATTPPPYTAESRVPNTKALVNLSA